MRLTIGSFSIFYDFDFHVFDLQAFGYDFHAKREPDQPRLFFSKLTQGNHPGKTWGASVEVWGLGWWGVVCREERWQPVASSE